MENFDSEMKLNLSGSTSTPTANYKSFTDDNTSTSTANINLWNHPKRLKVIELPNSIEMLYEQTSNMSLATYPPTNPQKRYFKIIFSCVDGKWNKSERIYGIKIESYFKFD